MSDSCARCGKPLDDRRKKRCSRCEQQLLDEEAATSNNAPENVKGNGHSHPEAEAEVFVPFPPGRKSIAEMVAPLPPKAELKQLWDKTVDKAAVRREVINEVVVHLQTVGIMLDAVMVADSYEEAERRVDFVRDVVERSIQSLKQASQ